MTRDQLQKISTLFTSNLSPDVKASFQEARKQIEENIDYYRENLTFIDQDYLNINRLLQIVWDYWRSNRRGGHSVDAMISQNKKAYTELTISNIKDIDKVIEQFV